MTATLKPLCAHAQEDAPFTWSITAGGGVTETVSNSINSVTTLGGAWLVRFAFGTSFPTAAEIAYIGSLRGFTAPGAPPRATLLQNGIEVAVRSNIVKAAVFPFFLFTGGWTNFKVLGWDTPTPLLRARSDNALMTSLGGGFGVRAGHFIMDIRGVFMLLVGEELFTISTEGPLSLSSWRVTLGLGVEL